MKSGNFPEEKELISRLCKYGCDVLLYPTVDSTNTRAKEYEKEHGGKDAVFIARGQTSGRGQQGRSFVSEEGLGLYMSYLCHTSITAADIPYLTAYAAVAVADAVRSLSGARAEIKWVNDVYIGNKKICGILCEGGFDSESDRLGYEIVGIGINLYKRDFKELSDIASDIETETGVKVPLSDVAEHILSSLTRLDLRDKRGIAAAYREMSLTLGKRLLVTEGEREYFAKAEEIADDLSLSVRLDGGEVRRLASGTSRTKIISN